MRVGKYWKDSRLEKPNCNACSQYIVIFRLLDRIPMMGLAIWMPKDNYTDGEWEEVTCTNGNKQGRKEVLFWRQWPNGPY